MYLISACLVGQPVRYDAKSYTYPLLQQLVDSGQAIIACPEMLGGLACPRAPAEIHGGTALDVLQARAHILDNTGLDVTQAFLNGAYQTLRLAQKHHVSVAILKEKSPSCGRHWIYDGQFTGQLITGMGLTATLLQQEGIQVCSEHDFISAWPKA